jgi:hypothetical protein
VNPSTLQGPRNRAEASIAAQLGITDCSQIYGTNEEIDNTLLDAGYHPNDLEAGRRWFNRRCEESIGPDGRVDIIGVRPSLLFIDFPIYFYFCFLRSNRLRARRKISILFKSLILVTPFASSMVDSRIG